MGVGIDDGLVLETKEDIFEMNNGCICCTVRGDLIRIIGKLLKRKQKFDMILIETTGLADPAPVAQTFYADDTLKENCSLDAIITMVDCKHIEMHLDDVKAEGVVNEAVHQVAFADRLLVNKTDLVSEEEKLKVKTRLRNINKYADMVETHQSKIDLDKILGIKSFNLERLMEGDTDAFKAKPEPKKHKKDDHKHDHDHDHDHNHDHDHKHDHDHDHDHDHKHDHDHDHKHDHDHHHHHDHKHDDGVTSVGIMQEGNLDINKLNEWLSALLQIKGQDIFRSKGLLSVKTRLRNINK